MSVFQVQLNNSQQGLLDLQYGAGNHEGTEFIPSIQRTAYIAGPLKINRLLTDGQIFTDCNYWKQFAYPQVPLDQAFINVVSDDGSIWSSSDPSENTFPYVFTVAVTAGSGYGVGMTVNGVSATSVNVFNSLGGPSTFTQIQNTGSVAVKIRLNGSATAIMSLAAGSVQVFNVGDLSITKLEIDNSLNGGTAAALQIIVSGASLPQS